MLDIEFDIIDVAISKNKPIDLTHTNFIISKIDLTKEEEKSIKNILGNYYCKIGKYKESFDYFSKAKNNSDDLNDLGAIIYRQNTNEDQKADKLAKQLFELALDLKPDHKLANANLKKLKEHQKEPFN